MDIGGQQREAPGQIVTFYSYKGGTGRTMALANVACLLAERSTRPVLVVDWDLEAPGLHRFLPARFTPVASDGADLGLGNAPGLIDLFIALRDSLPPSPPASEEEADVLTAKAFDAVRLGDYVCESTVRGVNILRAGRNDDGRYSERVGTFDWEGLFGRVPDIYREFGRRLAATHSYVLVDSRTGVTDISGICTYLLPERLVVVFTPNTQSLTGVRELVDRATTYRRNSDDLRPLLVFPLPSRIEASLEKLRDRWRFGDTGRGVIGYQPMFQDLLAKCYGLSECDLTSYFDDVQIQQTPDYAYGEEIAVGRTGDRFSMGNSYRVFVDRLLSGDQPWAALAAARQRTNRESGTEQRTFVPGREGGAMPSQAASHASDSSQERHASGSRLVVVSGAPEDRHRLSEIEERLQARGLVIWSDRNIPVGQRWDQAVAQALDRSDAVVVCWSKASVESQPVLSAAEEGLRRGILIPVLIEDVSPPLGFRSVQSADLRRPTREALEDLGDVVAQVAAGRPGTQAPPVGKKDRFTALRPALFAAIAVAVLMSAWLWLARGTPTPTAEPDARLQMARAYTSRQAGAFGVAIAQLSDAILLAGTDRELLRDLYRDRAYCYRLGGDWVNAVSDLTKALSVDESLGSTQRGVLLRDRGFAYFQLRDIEMASADFEALSGLDKGAHDQFRNFLRPILQRKGRSVPAVFVFTQASSNLDSNNPAVIPSAVRAMGRFTDFLNLRFWWAPVQAQLRYTNKDDGALATDAAASMRRLGFDVGAPVLMDSLIPRSRRIEVWFPRPVPVNGLRN